MTAHTVIQGQKNTRLWLHRVTATRQCEFAHYTCFPTFWKAPNVRRQKRVFLHVIPVPFALWLVGPIRSPWDVKNTLNDSSNGDTGTNNTHVLIVTHLCGIHEFTNFHLSTPPQRAGLVGLWVPVGIHGIYGIYGIYKRRFLCGIHGIYGIYKLIL